MNILKLLFVISFVFISLFCGCSSKKNITVVIENNLEKDIYVPPLGMAGIVYGDEKIYYLSAVDFIDHTNILSEFAYGIFNFIDAIKSNEIYQTQIKAFEINNKRYEFPIDENGIVTEVLKEPEYEQVFFKMCYTTEPFEIRSYEEYISILHEKGFSAIGYCEDNKIIFVIDTEASKIKKIM